MKNLFTVLVALCVAFSVNISQAQWVQTSGPTGGYVNAMATIGTNIFAAIGGNFQVAGIGIFRSTDDGVSWKEINTGLTKVSVNSLAVIGTNLFAGTCGGGVFLSINNGTSWTAVNNGLKKCVGPLAVIGANLFAGSLSGGGVFLSTDNGATWKEVNGGLGWGNTAVNVFAVSGTDLFAGTDYWFKLQIN